MEAFTVNCIICLSPAQKAFMCPECQKPICSVCLGEIRRSNNKCPTCRRKVDYIEMKLQNIKDNYNSSSLPLCTKHKKPLEYFCPFHEIIICEDCCLTEHNGNSCKVKSADTKKIEDLNKRYNDCISNLENLKEEYSKKDKEIEEKIKKFSEKQQEKLKDYMVEAKKKIKEEIDNKIKVENSKIQNKKVEIVNYKEQLTTLKSKEDNLDKLRKFIEIKNKINESLGKIDSDNMGDNNYFENDVNLDSIIPGYFFYDLVFEIQPNFDNRNVFKHLNKKWIACLNYKYDETSKNASITFYVNGLNKNKKNVVNIKLQLINGNIGNKLGDKNFKEKNITFESGDNNKKPSGEKISNYIDLEMKSRDLLDYVKVENGKKIIQFKLAFKYLDVFYKDIMDV